jgi:hypothetical protein
MNLRAEGVPEGWARLLRRRRIDIVLGLGLALLTAFALGPACACDFVNYDDPTYVTRNLDVQGGLGIEAVCWAFTATRSNHWHPLTWMSLQLDADLYGQQAWGFHLTNLLLHLGNVLLLFALLRQMTGAAGRSAAVAALFAVHPLRVESVAWVTERKDMLSTLFWLLTTAAYLRHVRRPDWRNYRWVFLSFALGLMAKSILVTLPCTLLLLDFWPLRRWAARGGQTREKEAPALASVSFLRLIGEKLPLFGLSIVSGAVSMYARHAGGGLKSGEYLALGERLGYAVNAAAAYLGKTFWPVDLAPFYPLTPGGLPAWRVAGAAVVLGVLTAAAGAAYRRRPYLLVGWLWYLITLLPVSGLVQLGSYALADRYTCVPSIGLFVALVWGVADLVPRPAHLRLLAPAAVILLCVLALVSRQQVGHWRDSIALWEHTRAATPDNFFARTMLGFAYQEVGRLDEAKDHFAAAIRLRPDQERGYENFGRLLLRQNRAKEAVAFLCQALERLPKSERLRILLERAQRDAAEKGRRPDIPP